MRTQALALARRPPSENGQPVKPLELRLTAVALSVLARDLLTRDNDGLEAESHPTEADVVRYLEGRQDSVIEAHLETCPNCVTRASALADEVAVRTQAPAANAAVPARSIVSLGVNGFSADPRELLLANLSLLRDLVGFLARRYRLNAEQIEELESFVRLRLVEDDYDILRRWRHHSTLRTYLTVVMQRLFHDYCNQLWGKWRASAAALRLGPVAEALEELLYREGLTFAEACQMLGARGGVGPEELTRLEAQLPPRPGRPRTQPLGTDAVAHPAPLPSPEDEALQSAEEEELTVAVAASLRICVRRTVCSSGSTSATGSQWRKLRAV